MHRGVVMRGLRFGLAVGLLCTLGWGALWLVGLAAGLAAGRGHDVLAALMAGLGLAAGSLTVGTLLGLALGTALALVPGRLTSRRFPRGVLAGLVAGTLFVGEVVVIAAVTDGGPLPTLVAMAGVPLVGVVAADHSGDIAGIGRRHGWLWAQAPAWAEVRTLTWRKRVERMVRLLWN